MNNILVNVRNCKLSLKQSLAGTLQSYQVNNMIMYGLNMEKLLMLVKYQMVMMQ